MTSTPEFSASDFIDRSKRIEKYREWDTEFLLELNDRSPIKEPKEKITEHIEGERVLPPGGPMPGPYSFDVNPYMIEPQNKIALSDPTQSLGILKGVQITCTATLVENSVGYYIGENPVEQMLVSGTDDLLKEWVDLRLEPLLDSLRLRRKIFAQFGNKKNRKTGDTQDAKFYAGGALHLCSARSAPKQRMKSKQVIYIDEADSAPKELTTGEGNFVAVVQGRQSTYDTRKKFVILSTPTTFERSVIWPIFVAGDQRHFYWPCPHCGAFFTPLTIDTDNQKCDWSLFKAEVAPDGEVVDCWCECPHCSDKIFNHHKMTMLRDGEWKAHSKSRDPLAVSYYIPAFLSPVGMLSWKDIYKKYLEAIDDPTRMPAWVNLYLGFPFKEQGEKPKLAVMRELVAGYKRGNVPNGVLFLTMAIDVQRGQKANKKSNKKAKPARLEIEIVGHGAGYRSWQVDYWVIEGDIKDPAAGAWAELNKRAAAGELGFKRDDGFVFYPRLTLIDSGDGLYYETVYTFSEGWKSTHPCKGFGGDGLKRRKGENKDDEVSLSNFKRYRHALMKQGVTLVEISTNYYKNILYKSLGKRRGADGTIPPGCQLFPKECGTEYFKQLTAEERLHDGTFLPTQRAHEALDLRVYNLCARDIVMDMLLESMRMTYRENGNSHAEIAALSKADVLRWLEMHTKRLDA